MQSFPGFTTWKFCWDTFSPPHPLTHTPTNISLDRDRGLTIAVFKGSIWPSDLTSSNLRAENICTGISNLRVSNVFSKMKDAARRNIRSIWLTRRCYRGTAHTISNICNMCYICYICCRLTRYQIHVATVKQTSRRWNQISKHCSANCCRKMQKHNTQSSWLRFPQDSAIYFKIFSLTQLW